MLRLSRSSLKSWARTLSARSTNPSPRPISTATLQPLTNFVPPSAAGQTGTALMAQQLLSSRSRLLSASAIDRSYLADHALSISDPDAYWSEIAANNYHWEKSFDASTVLKYNFHASKVRTVASVDYCHKISYVATIHLASLVAGTHSHRVVQRG